MPSDSPILHLSRIEQGIPALTPVFGAFLSEACQVCLYESGHSSGAWLTLLDDERGQFQVQWEGEISDQALRAWSDPQEATEYGATCMAILLVLHMSSYTVVRRSFKGTGFDYWLGDTQSEFPFQDAARLEISGIREGDETQIRQRAKAKLTQTRRSRNTGLPALVIIVEFRNLRALCIKT